MKAVIIFLEMFLIIFISEAFTQTIPNDFNCSSIHDPNVAHIDNFNGSAKPNRTDLSGDDIAPSDAYFPVLVVFVQFKNEASDPRNSWPINSAPVYLNNMIARNKNNTGDWWNFYSPEKEILSSHWIDISRGKFHVISPVPSDLNPAFSVVLPFEASYYQSLGSVTGEFKINEDIWKSLRSQGLTDWRAFDRWKYNTADGRFYFTPMGEGDGYVDMIYKIHKSRGIGGLINYAGYNSLSYFNFGMDYLVDAVNNIKINYGNDFKGSGVTISFRGQLSQYIMTAGHEHGHQMFSSAGHSTYSRVSFGFGLEGFYSPSDMILNGYMSPSTVNFNSVNTLGDYSSRNSGNGNLLKIPVSDNEYFLLASRNKVSKWDRVMLGDVAQIDPYNDNSENGKGLYIYHVPKNLTFPTGDISQQDMECADGLFEWEYAGKSAQQVIYDCFISAPDQWYYYQKKNVMYENDSSNLFRYYLPPNYTSRPIGDGISFRPGFLDKNYNLEFHYKWWGAGEKPENSCSIGTDRLLTNKAEIFTRFDVGGDREDPWNPGYNEMFSPYSSPNTNTWANNKSGIFIWYRSFNSSLNEADIEVFKVGEKGMTEEKILELTPPSRPMGLTIVSEDKLQTDNSYNAKHLRWNHNNEPDMERFTKIKDQKAKVYNIFRNNSEDINQTPNDELKYSEKVYKKIATVQINSDSTPEFTDSSLICLNNNTDNKKKLVPVRYRIQAVDKYENVSVLSDFVKTEEWASPNSPVLKNILVDINQEENNIPDEFSLMQNYPNPFNPSTTIQYELPVDNFVSLKLYDITGKEIMTIVNEFKNAGRHKVLLNLGKFSSGIYFYRINAGEFTGIRKIALIK